MQGDGKELVPVEQPSQALALLEQGRRLLAEARTIGEVMNLRDYAEQARHWARQRGMSLEAMNDAAELKIRAERRIGEMLRSGGLGRHGGNRKSSAMLALEDVGLTGRQSSRYLKVASVQEADFEAHVSEMRQAGGELTTAGVYRLAQAIAQGQRHAAQQQQEMKGGRVAYLEELAQQGRTFGTIYADPPWQYEMRADDVTHRGRCIYSTMAAEDICALPVKPLAAKNCHLHLWTTNNFLREAFAVLDAWGFEQKSCFVWCKPQMGMGHYWRVSHEFLLLGVRGSGAFPVHDMKSWGEFDRDRHSSKPGQVRLMIERASPGPRLEMFARMEAPGWVAWGNEVETDLFSEKEQQ